MSSKAGVLPVVLAALQRVGKINQALRSRDQQGSTPLALATSSPRFFDNFSALLAACDINTPEVIQWKNKGGMYGLKGLVGLLQNGLLSS
jgi:hypothetical protein